VVEGPRAAGAEGATDKELWWWRAPEPWEPREPLIGSTSRTEAPV